MNKKYLLYVLIWLLVMVIFSSDLFSYHATRKIIKDMFLFFDPNIPMKVVLKFHAVIRKVLHVINFGILSWLILCFFVRSFSPLSRWDMKIGIRCILFCVLYSLFEEWRQSLTLTRTPMLLDIFLDFLGATLVQLGCFLYLTFKRRLDSSDV